MSLDKCIDANSRSWMAHQIEESWSKFEHGAATLEELHALKEAFAYFPQVDTQEAIDVIQREIDMLARNPALAKEREELSKNFDLLAMLEAEGDEGDEGDYADYSEAEEVEDEDMDEH